MSDLQQLAADLAYTAGPGAAQLASSVSRSGQEEAETGARVPLGPGPGLRSILARHSGSAKATSPVANADPSAVATHAATRLADSGAALLMGQRP